MNSSALWSVVLATLLPAAGAARPGLDVSDAPPLPDALSELIRSSRESRRELLQLRARLVQQLAASDGATRAALLEAFRSEHREAIAAEREQRREVRRSLEEIRRARRQQPGPVAGGGS